MRKIYVLLTLSVLVVGLVLGACQPQTIVETVVVEKIVEVEKEVEVVVEKEVEVEVEKTVIVEVEKEEEPEVKPEMEYQFALILPGSIQDADFNTNGYLMVQQVKEELGIEATFSEQVSPSDAERVAQEYIGAGYNIVGFYGGQFRNALLNLTDKYPEVSFIILTGGKSDDIDVYWVPGALEISVVAARVAKAGKHDAVICLGAVIRGQTPHFDYVAGQAARGIAQVGLETGVPTIFGVLTTDSIEQAIERAGMKAGNKGAAAAAAALELVDLLAGM